MENEPVRILFTGDLFIEKTSNEPILTQALQNFFDLHDIKCCNFEAPIRMEKEIGADIYGATLSQPLTTAQRVKEAGFNLIALANNHIMNYGKEGLEATLQTFIEIHTIGAGMTYEKIYTPFICTIKGITLGFINAAECQYGSAEQYNGYGHAWIMSSYLRKQIQLAKKRCDYLILICHGGMENVDIPLPEWRMLYRELIDLGVDIIIGHHPHVVQGWEVYHDKMIFYSLGNFLWHSERIKSAQGPSILVSIEFTSDKIKPNILPIQATDQKVSFYQKSEFQEYLSELCDMLANNQAYFSKINRLCINAYHQTYLPNAYELAGLRPPRNIFDKFVNLFLILIGKIEINEKLLYIWVSDETLRWIIKRALIEKNIMKR